MVKSSHTDMAGGTPTSGSGKNLFAKARARRLLCIPARDTVEATKQIRKKTSSCNRKAHHLSQKILFSVVPSHRLTCETKCQQDDNQLEKMRYGTQKGAARWLIQMETKQP
jgi:hypothetical protein